jgi:putative membrane protein
VNGWLPGAYPWLKALHIIAVIAWMAGLLYLPRLYVYHAAAPAGSRRAATFEIMERRLLRAIMLPAAAMTYAFGLLLAATPGVVDWHQGWIWVKLGLVLLLTTFHLLLEHWRRDFAERRFSHSVRFYRIANELPTLTMVAIVLLVVVKPF